MPAVNQEAERIVRGMKRRSASRFRRLYGKRAKDVMYATANKLAQKEQVKMPPTYNEIFGEANKSGDNSLRDWFSKSKSSDGKPGWVQLGGKYAGKPCAKQPGQTTKPKCGSSKMKRNLNKDEEEAAFRRKQKEDPNPDRKGKAINVKTEDLDLKKMSKELDGASKMHKGQSERIKKHLKKMKEATYPQDFKGGPVAKKKTGKPNAQGDYGKKDIQERGDFWHPDPDKDRKLGGPGANQRAREDRAAASKPKSDPKKLRPGESYMQYAKRMKTRKEDCWDGYEKKGMKTMFGKKYPNCVKKTKKEEVEIAEAEKKIRAKGSDRSKKIIPDAGPAYYKKAKDHVKYEEVGVQEGMGDIAIKAIEKTNPPYLSKRSSIIRGIKSKQLDSYLKKVDKKKAERAAKKNEELEFAGELMTEEQFDEAAGEKAACYKKVKARYSVWPSAYASGALVKCRKVGADNWGNKSKK